MGQILLYGLAALVLLGIGYYLFSTILVRLRTTPLHRAARTGNLSAIRELVARGFDINAGAGSIGTPLMVATNKKQHDVMRVLISLGAKVEAVDKLNQTALYYAAVSGDLCSVRILLEAHAPTNTISSLIKKTPSEMAEILGYQAVADLIHAHLVKLLSTDPNYKEY